MEVERTGALSYDVSAPEGEPSAQRGIVYGAVALLVTMVGGWIAGWFVLGVVRDERVVTAGVPLLMLAGVLAGTAWGTRTTLRRARRNAFVVMATITVASGFLTYQTLASIKPAIPQVQRALDEIDLPDGFRVTSEETHGDRFCRRGCPTVQRHCAAPATDPDPVATFMQAMVNQGWSPTADVEARLATAAQKSGIVVQLAEKEHTVEVTASRQ